MFYSQKFPDVKILAIDDHTKVWQPVSEAGEAFMKDFCIIPFCEMPPKDAAAFEKVAEQYSIRVAYGVLD